MTDEEIAAKKKADADALADAWLKPNVDKSKKIEPDEPADKADQFEIDINGHRGGIAETMRRIDAKQKAATDKKPPSDTDDDSDEAKAAKKKADDEAAKSKVKFKLFPDKVEGKPSADADPASKKAAADTEAAARKAADKPPESKLTAEDQAFIAKLPAELQDSVEFWQDAEAVDPDRYKGKLQAQLDYLKRFQSEVDRLTEDDPDFDPESSPELQRWVRQQSDRPTVTRKEQEHVLEKKIEKKFDQRNSQQEARRQQELRMAEEKPKVDKIAADFQDGISEDIPEDIAKTYQDALKDGDHETAMQAVSDEHGYEVAQALSGVTSLASGVGRAFVAITRGVEAFDPANQTHVQASKTVEELGKLVLENDALEAMRTNDKGQKFMPREVYFAADTTDEARAKHFTFTEDQVLQLLRSRTKKQLDAQLTDARAKAKSREERILKRHGVDPKKKGDADANQDTMDPPARRMANQQQEAKDQGAGGLVDFMMHGNSRRGSSAD